MDLIGLFVVVIGTLCVVVVVFVAVFPRLSLALTRLVAAGARTTTVLGGKWAEQNCSAGG